MVLFWKQGRIKNTDISRSIHHVTLHINLIWQYEDNIWKSEESEILGSKISNFLVISHGVNHMLYWEILICVMLPIFLMMQLILIPPNFLSSSLVCDTWSGSTVLYSNNLLTSRLICVVKNSSKSTFYLIFHCVLCMLF